MLSTNLQVEEDSLPDVNINPRNMNEPEKPEIDMDINFEATKVLFYNYTLIFEENGYTIDYFDYSSGDLKNQVVWCRQNPCTVQVLGSLNRTLEAIIYDEGRQYSFKNDDLKQFVVLSQNGLNPLKDYLVEIRYVDNQDNYSSFFREISGEYLIGSE